MICSATEYETALRRLAEATERLEQQRGDLQARGFTPAEVKCALDPARSFHALLADEIGDYERLLTSPGREGEDQ